MKNVAKLLCFLFVSFLLPISFVNATQSSSASLPSSFSKLNQIDGITVRRGKGAECQFAFDRAFGEKRNELDFLKTLIAHGYDLNNDIDCDTIAALDALHHLKTLAIEQKNKEVIDTLLLDYDKFGLDGEYAESYGMDYIVPVLLSMPSIDKYMGDLIKEQRDDIITQAALAIASPFSDLEPAKTITQFRDRNGKDFAAAVEKEVAKYSDK